MVKVAQRCCRLRGLGGAIRSRRRRELGFCCTRLAAWLLLPRQAAGRQAGRAGTRRCTFTCRQHDTGAAGGRLHPPGGRPFNCCFPTKGAAPGTRAGARQRSPPRASRRCDRAGGCKQPAPTDGARPHSVFSHTTPKTLDSSRQARAQLKAAAGAHACPCKKMKTPSCGARPPHPPQLLQSTAHGGRRPHSNTQRWLPPAALGPSQRRRPGAAQPSPAASGAKCAAALRGPAAQQAPLPLPLRRAAPRTHAPQRRAPAPGAPRQAGGPRCAARPAARSAARSPVAQRGAAQHHHHQPATTRPCRRRPASSPAPAPPCRPPG
jgi:hypothetical protein